MSIEALREAIKGSIRQDLDDDASVRTLDEQIVDLERQIRSLRRQREARGHAKGERGVVLEARKVVLQRYLIGQLIRRAHTLGAPTWKLKARSIGLTDVGREGGKDSEAFPVGLVGENAPHAILAAHGERGADRQLRSQIARECSAFGLIHVPVVLLFVRSDGRAYDDMATYKSYRRIDESPLILRTAGAALGFATEALTWLRGREGDLAPMTDLINGPARFLKLEGA